MTTLQLVLTEAELTRMQSIAQATARTPEQLAREAVVRYLDLETWQLADIEAGLREAEAGEFASEDEVKAVFARHGA